MEAAQPINIVSTEIASALRQRWASGIERPVSADESAVGENWRKLEKRKGEHGWIESPQGEHRAHL